MNISIHGDKEDVIAGIEALSDRLGYKIKEQGELAVSLKREQGDLKVIKEKNKVTIIFDQRIHLFRGLSLAIEGCAEENFEINETPQFKTNGIMLDVSRGLVPTVSTIKDFIINMALMGLNMLMLYTEDTYEIENEPYFGYMRGRYTYDELKECDDFADKLGIEIIPCIQTLGHMEQFLKWPSAKKYSDTERVLLANDQDTYKFIEKSILSAVKPFRSKRIHIGMDEAKDVGLGRYLVKHGFEDRFDVINKHVSRVTGIAESHGLKPMIWSDMYFELASKTGYYYESGDIDEEIVSNIPARTEFVYWDYYNDDEEFYIDFIKKHKKMGKPPIFAGGVWCWTSFGTDYEKTFKTTIPALRACKKEGVTEVFATLWGCAETSYQSALMGLQLFAELGYSDELDIDAFKKRTEFCTGIAYDDFTRLTKLYKLPGQQNDFAEPPNPTSCLLWQDVMLGLYDADVSGIEISKHYQECFEELRAICAKSHMHEMIFKVPEIICELLSVKGELGIRLKNAYDANDKEQLSKIANEELPWLIDKTNQLREAHRKYYFAVNKAFGFELCDMRYGGLLARLDTARARIYNYLDGGIKSIEELCEARLPFDSTEPGKYALRWRKYSQISMPHMLKYFV